jgi:DNA-binding response OmpR family regulator
MLDRSESPNKGGGVVRDAGRRVLVAESDPAVRRLLVQRLDREGFDVIEMVEPLVAKEKVAVNAPDVVLLELGGPPGFAALISLREVSDVPVVGMLWTDVDADEAVALDLGADDCLARPVSFRHLVARTNAVLRRTAAALERHLRYGVLDIDVASRTVRVRERRVELAAREFDLLAFLAARPNEVFSREQLLAHVWQSSPDWQQRETVTEHVHRIRSRLEDDPGRPRWLITVRGVGYRFSP